MARPLLSKNVRLLTLLSGVVVLMVGVSFAAVPLYELFCRVTGYGGTTQRADTSDVGVVADRQMTIRFDANTVPGMAWSFRPVQTEMTVKVGESGMAFYRATNPTEQATWGQATFNVTPLKAGLYFTKVQCFCFDEQKLAAGQSVDMPVYFYVDPEIMTDPNLDDVNTITLSYTFFPLDGKDGDGYDDPVPSGEQVSDAGAAAGVAPVEAVN